MIRIASRSLVAAITMAMLSLSFVVIAAPAADAATLDGYATAWAVYSPNPVATFFPPYNGPPGPVNPLGASNDLCQDSTFVSNVFEFTFGALPIPGGSTIQGIEVTIDAGIAAGDTPDVTLTNGTGTDAVGGDIKTLSGLPQGPCSSTVDRVLGSPTDDWNASLGAGDFAAGNFGVKISGAIFMDSINLKVHYGGANTTPVAVIGGPYTVDEGGTIVLDGSGSSDLDGDTLTYAWDLDNDGVFGDATGVAPTFSAAGRDGPGSQTIALRVNDGTEDSLPDSGSVIIENVAPTLSGLAATAVSENGSTSLTGTITDLGVPDTFTLDIDWDGDAVIDETVAASAGAFSVPHQYLDDDPSGTPSDIYTINVTVTDDDGGADSGSTSVTVNNIAPTLFGLVATAISENGSTTLSGSYSDPGTLDTFTLEIDWDGDLAFDETVPVAGGIISVPHQYLDDDPTGTPSDIYTINVQLVDDDTGTATSATAVTVSNVDPVIDSLSVTPMIDEDGTVSLSGSFTDVGLLDTHEVSVNWGDGGPVETATLVQGSGSGSFTAGHQYLDDDPTGTPQDTYTISVTVTDDDTGSDSESAQTIVKNVDPVIESIISDATFDSKADEGEPVTVSGTFTDVGTLDTHTGTVDWGDGTITAATIGAGTFTASHAYVAGGVYSVEVTIVDDDTGEATSTTTAVVTGVGINGGVLQIVGTSGNDHVVVKRVNDEIDVFASFLNPKHRRFDLAAVTSVEMWLCEGNDHGDVHQSITADAVLHGDDGGDKLKGGSGNDMIDGGSGNDMLWGRDGDDVLDGGPGNDKLFGGKGTNTLID